MEVRIRFTGRAEGDLAPPSDDVDRSAIHDYESRQRRVLDLPWTWLNQVHGAEVVEVSSPGEGAGARADAAVSATPGCALAVLTADCAPVALASAEGVHGVAHAGWRGLLAGVVERTVEAMRRLGATDIRAELGPCIRAGCYEFGADGVDAVAARLGPTVRARTPAGRPALDLAAGVGVALQAVGVDDLQDAGVCTACSTNHFSWRSRRDQGRQATVVWGWT